MLAILQITHSNFILADHTSVDHLRELVRSNKLKWWQN